VHSDAEVVSWFTTVVSDSNETWLLAATDALLAFMVLDEGRIEQLYVDPYRTGHGLGSLLIALAKTPGPGGLDLWTFQTNLGARRFYERHGCTPIASTDGDNEEGAPDIHYEWRPTELTRQHRDPEQSRRVQQARPATGA
jgi:GNAT superfamily N-acetyltransferase